MTTGDEASADSGAVPMPAADGCAGVRASADGSSEVVALSVGWVFGTASLLVAAGEVAAEVTGGATSLRARAGDAAPRERTAERRRARNRLNMRTPKRGREDEAPGGLRYGLLTQSDIRELPDTAGDRVVSVTAAALALHES
jgi:hypothetical protein